MLGQQGDQVVSSTLETPIPVEGLQQGWRVPKRGHLGKFPHETFRPGKSGDNCVLAQSPRNDE